MASCVITPLQHLVTVLIAVVMKLKIYLHTKKNIRILEALVLAQFFKKIILFLLAFTKHITAVLNNAIKQSQTGMTTMW